MDEVYCFREVRVSANTQLREELLRHFDALPPDLQQRLADEARDLARVQKGVPGSQLMHLVGIMDPADAAEMMAAIEEGCEQIDPDGW